ncbi:uncharacterized protein LOC110753955 [Prunus avium]|uniref:Uncharacterized protein LOC110753955 n=1 Tax=Prunus avium TaxID=42229 RepID=A0A6P5SA34_PRUAV|nr:uncharacterized protein LOC110753955 [Prunus avium]
MVRLSSTHLPDKDCVPSRFQAMWFTHPEFSEFITDLWQSNNGNTVLKSAGLVSPLVSWNRQEELFWLQKSRNTWLKERGRNTRFFHLSTVIRRRRNKLEGLNNEAGNWFAPHLFSRLADTDLEGLSCEVTDDEVKNSLFAIGGLKTPGSEGFPALFYQKYWGMCYADIIALVKDCFLTASLPENINETLIALVPKIEGHVSMTQLRPISLCNTLYKVISKILVARLRPYMASLVSPNQVSFVPGRQIVDNIVVAQEMLHKFKISKGGKGFIAWNFIAWKVDLSKAYDRLSWDFIREVVWEVGICGRILELLMQCINSVRYKLSHIIQQSIQDKAWKPVQICQSGPFISHLFFAGDLILFGKASVNQAIVMKNCLDGFCRLSGQKKLDQLNRNFLWGHTTDQAKVHLVNWDTACKPKFAGGLGIKNSAPMNQALLAKTGWHLLQCEQGLWAQVFNAKYLRHCDILAAKDLQFQSSSNQFALIDLSEDMLQLNASDFLEDGVWDFNYLVECLLMNIVNLILSTHAGYNGSGEDKCIRQSTSNGQFSVKTAYSTFYLDEGNANWKWDFIWKLHVLPKVKTFLWVLCHKKLLTNAQRLKRKLTNVAVCPICECPLESCVHLFKDCTATLAIWNRLGFGRVESGQLMDDYDDWLLNNLKLKRFVIHGLRWYLVFAIFL